MELALWPRTAQEEEELVKRVLMGCLAVFLLAILFAPDNDHGTGPQNSTLSNKERKLLQSMKEEIYKDMFGATHRGGNSFMTSEEARNFLRVDPSTRKRKPHCGRWMTNVRRLVLRVMGRRCASLQLS